MVFCNLLTIEGGQIKWGASVHGTSEISARKRVVFHNIAIYFANYRKQDILQKTYTSTLLGIHVAAHSELLELLSTTPHTLTIFLLYQ